jgi:hypothetical protein
MLHQACIMHSWRDGRTEKMHAAEVPFLFFRKIAAEYGQERKPGAVLFRRATGRRERTAMAGMYHIDAPPTLCP